VEFLDKKDYIQRIAFKLFLNIGYDATSIRKICKEAEIDPPTLYNFFGSKKGLFLAVTEALLAQLVQETKSNHNLLSSLPPEMQLYSIFSMNINFAVTHFEETKFFFRYSLFCPKELQDEVAVFLKSTHEAKCRAVNHILHECMQKKIIGIDFEQAASYYWKFVNNHTFNVVFENWQPSKEELLELWKMFFKCRLKGAQD